MRSAPLPLHQALVRHALFIAALLTYLLDPVDIVWRAVQHTAHPRAYERVAFLTAAAFLATALALAARPTRQEFPAAASFLYTAAIAFLLPWEGALLLVCGELLRSALSRASPTSHPARKRTWIYLSALLSMLLFSLTLQDRLADILFGFTFFLALVLDFLPGPRSAAS